jgi:hypothetical protein
MVACQHQQKLVELTKGWNKVDEDQQQTEQGGEGHKHSRVATQPTILKVESSSAATTFSYWDRALRHDHTYK